MRGLLPTTAAGLAVLAALTLATGAASAPAPTLLRTDGIGPLRLGMSRAQALATGWLVGRGRGCPLFGTPPITYRFGGRAPSRLRGSVEFSRGRLTDLTVTRGVRTATGVTVGATTRRMLELSRAAGFTAAAEYVPEFQGTFVRVVRDGRQVLGAFSGKRSKRVEQLSIPDTVICD